MSLEGCQHVGVDWGNGQWIAIGLHDDEAITADGYDSMDDIWTTTEATAERIVVDIPIGLCDPVDDADACCMVEPDGCRRCLTRRSQRGQRSTDWQGTDGPSEEHRSRDCRVCFRAFAEVGAEPDIDDVLDALALVHTTAAPADEWQTLPESPPTGRESLPMQMVYRRSEPFAV